MPTLTWLTRDEDLKRAGRAPYRLLEPVPELSYGDPDAGNMLIQGDNLDALKALLPYFAGKVKCIYIDPPYNTRSAFEQYDDNLEHSQWLAMMYPRLELLRALLSEDGSIWVSIDDKEGDYLKLLMDEIFGRRNFVNKIIWQKIFSPKNTARHFSEDHDYLVVFAKDAERWFPNRMGRSEAQDARYKNPDNDPRGVWTSGDVSARNFYSEGTYPIECPSGRVIPGPPNGMFWRVSKSRFEELARDNRIWWGKDGNGVPRIKRFLSEVRQGRVPQTLWMHSEVGHTQEAKKEIVALFGQNAFATPKPERLLLRVLEIGSNEGDVVMDSFLGSGTTAAVAQKIGRRYIGIESGEQAASLCSPRLQKVIAGESGGISDAVGWKGGGGFRFYRLGTPIFDAQGQIRRDVSFSLLAAHVWFSETGSALGKVPRSPLLGIRDGTALCLLYNGVLGDKRPNGGNVLTRAVLADLRKRANGSAERFVVYGERCLIGADALRVANVFFKQTPYDIRAR